MRSLILALCLWLPFSASAQANPTNQTDEVRWVEISFKNFEKDAPGWGYSRSYQSKTGWITVYSYTLGQTNWQEGTDDERLIQIFKNSIAEIQSKHDEGVYQNLEFGQAKVRNVAGTPYFHINMSYQSEGKTLLSSLYLTVKHGKLLKYRMSYTGQPDSSADSVSASFIQRTQNIEPKPAVNDSK